MKSLNPTVWIEQSLKEQGIKLTGEITATHRRPWSTVLHVPTDSGDVYFKAVGPPFAFEPPLTDVLYHLYPDCIPRVFAVDPNRGWILTADGGQTLRQAFKNGLDRQTWNEVLALYGGLQIDLAARVDSLLALGTRDRRTSKLPELYKTLLEEKEWLLLDQKDGLTTADYRRLVNMLPQVEAMCRQLAAYAVPDSLHHNDLHDANVFYNNGAITFFDWGDSSIAHPFFSLRTVFVSMEYSFDLEEDDPIFDEFAWAYLLPWLVYETEEDLWQAYRLASRQWSLSSAVKYKTQMQQIAEMRQEYATAVPGLLLEFLAKNPNYSL
ncbi:MAG: phosphotransferase [Candidatus Promineifilaceae bacterium]